MPRLCWQVVYDDGDEEHVDWAELQRLISTAQAREAARSARKRKAEKAADSSMKKTDKVGKVTL